MGSKVDLSGKRFGRLIVLQEEEPHYTKGGSKKRMWLCKCDCGKTKIVNGNSLVCGRTKSCGCLLVDNGRAKSKGDRHRDRLYILWIGMRQRCNNKNHKSYKWYGGKGIKVCDEWDNDYESFEKWAYDNGYDKTLPRGVQTIDRINSDLDYSPDNCRWATQKEQVRNSSQYTKMVEITREPLTLLSDITDAVPYFFGKDVHIDPETQEKTLDTEVSQNVLKDFVPNAKTWDWTDENLHEKLADFRAEWKEKGVKPKVTMWAIRAAITGRTFGADMVGILDILGKETSLYRAEKAIK